MSSGALKEVMRPGIARGVSTEYPLEGGVVLGLWEQKDKGKDSKENETGQAGGGGQSNPFPCRGGGESGEADGRLGQLI